MTYRVLRTSLAASVAALLLALAGCGLASTQLASSTRAFVASEKDAQLVVDSQRSNVNAVYLTRVVSPATGLVVVTAPSAQGGSTTVGSVAVPRGESTGVRVPLGDVASTQVTVTLYVDRGRIGTLETGMGDPSKSPDRPVFAAGRLVAVPIALQPDGVNVRAGAAALDVVDQPRSNAIEITHVAAPGPSWLAVYAEEGGRPGRLLTTRSIQATDAIDVLVPVSLPATATGAYVALQVDAGEPGRFDYGSSFDASSTAPDRPYVAGGTELVRRVGFK